MHLRASLHDPAFVLGSPADSLTARPAAQVASLAFALALFTIALRLPNFGDPTYHIDEAFYLYVGQAMRDGAMPYAEVWDRKPAGLFFLYALFPEAGAIYWYQAVAALFAWATAFTLALIASAFASRFAAGVVGVLYLALIGALAGGGGQSPVFYNLFIAFAALLVLRGALDRTSGVRSRSDYAAMLLCGLALTFKPTALPEGIFLGLVLLWNRWRISRSTRSVALHGLRLTSCAFVPTALIWVTFAWLGHFGDYWFATMQSIFLTQAPQPGASATRLVWLAHITWLPAVLALCGLAILARRASSRLMHDVFLAAFVGGWLAAAFAGFLLIANFYDHYALPLASILAVSSAPLYDRRGTGPLLAVLASSYLLLASGFPAGQMERKAAAQAGYAEATTMIARHIGDGCLFVYDVTPALYLSFNGCPSNKYAFPEHLSNQREADAIGASPLAALRTALDRKPAVVVTSVSPSISTPNASTRSALERELAAHYRKAGETALRDVVGRQEIAIWARVE